MRAAVLSVLVLALAAGTTAAALGVLMAENGLTDLMTRAVAAATARSEELAKG